MATYVDGIATISRSVSRIIEIIILSDPAITHKIPAIINNGIHKSTNVIIQNHIHIQRVFHHRPTTSFLLSKSACLREIFSKPTK